MTNQKKERKPRTNRPTDPFGGPTSGRRAISFNLVIIAFAIFALIYWTKGDVGRLFNGSAAIPTVAAPTGNGEQTQSEATEDEAEVAEATATRPQRNTPTPAGAGQARATETPRAPQPTATANAPPASRASDLPTIAYAELPEEAHETIALIEQDGPFPFSRDGITFQNRERILPRQPEGYYREYTVITPGENDRGARRIITGEAGEMYYTDDHYESFSEIVR